VGDDPATRPEELESYVVDGKPWGVGEGEIKWLSIRPDEEAKLVRRGFYYMTVARKEGEEATVEITLHHQRRGKVDGTWDETPFLLHKLHAGEAIRLPFDSDETLALYKGLEALYGIGAQGVRSGRRSYVMADKSTIVATGGATEALKALIQRHGQEAFITAVSELDAGSGFELVALLKRDYELKAAALKEFEQHLVEGDPWTENDWQKFFEANDWIFGHGLDYRFLVTEVVQPNVGGTNVTGKGGQKGDFLLGSSGDVRFSVLVEIKTPDTPLLGKTKYRNGAWKIGEELADGASQMQANVEAWTRTATQVENEEWSDETGVITVQPKGILVIGHLRQLDRKTKVRTFERFRQNLWNPEIITYDELRDRAKFLVQRADQDASGVGPEAEDDDERPEDWEPDDNDGPNEPNEADGPDDDDEEGPPDDDGPDHDAFTPFARQDSHPNLADLPF
jgi:hypothetical protein